MKYALSMIVFVFVSCSTIHGVRTSADRKITQTQQQLDATARDFIAAANNIITQVNDRTPDPRLQQAIDIIKKSQVLLRGELDDGAAYNTKDTNKLQRQIDDAYQKNRELIDRIEHLENARDVASDALAAKDIAHQATQRKEFWDRFKWYSVVLVLLSSVVTFVVYVPPAVVRKFLGAFGSK